MPHALWREDWLLTEARDASRAVVRLESNFP